MRATILSTIASHKRRHSWRLSSYLTSLLVLISVLDINQLAAGSPTLEARAGNASIAEPSSVSQPEEETRRQQRDDEYLIGLGLADITGPAADVNLMGYAKSNQNAGGIHLRQFSRSVIVAHSGALDAKRILYISLDNGMVSTLLRVKVLDELRQIYGPHMYNESNVMMSATHTHSAPGGFFQYMIYSFAASGFINQTLEALKGGIVRSVRRAHDSLQPGKIYFNQGELLGANINRSPVSYENNPQEERAKYQYDTEKTMYLLKFVDRKGNPIGMLNWFAVHGVSMNNTNHLISSDNKGYAAILFEQDLNPAGTMPGTGKFVAIFAQSNEGDVSPNTAGPRCIDTGLPCDPYSSTCGNPPRNAKCIAFGPGKDMFESTKIIAYKQYQKARQLFFNESSQGLVTGPIDFIHEHLDMTNQVVPNYKNAIDLAKRNSLIKEKDTYRTCRGAYGYSFAAGTTDGPGVSDFRQGKTEPDLYWSTIRNILRKPSQEQVECHRPKPILLSVGEMDFPNAWAPSIVPTQILKIGQVAIVGLPAEFTTMSGRRVKEAVREQLSRVDRNSAPRVVLSGLSNAYTSYVTTLEEYVVQRYEAGSTIYGPHTLQAYVNQFSKLAAHLAEKRPIVDRLRPPDLSKNLISWLPGVVYDGTPIGRSFGDILNDVNHDRPYACGQVVNVSFVSANPRNNLRQEDTFLKVDRYAEDGSWQTVATDASWETKFIWDRINSFTGESKATVVWEILHECQPGTYVIRHFGTSKNLLGRYSNFEGRSSAFLVAKSDTRANELRRQFDEARSNLNYVASSYEQPDVSGYRLKAESLLAKLAFG